MGYPNKVQLIHRKASVNQFLHRNQVSHSPVAVKKRCTTPECPEKLVCNRVQIFERKNRASCVLVFRYSSAGPAIRSPFCCNA